MAGHGLVRVRASQEELRSHIYCGHISTRLPPTRSPHPALKKGCFTAHYTWTSAEGFSHPRPAENAAPIATNLSSLNASPDPEETAEHQPARHPPISEIVYRHDERLFLRYLRRKRYWILVAAVFLFGFLCATAYMSIPRLLDRRAKKTAITSAQLDAAKSRLKPSEHARLKGLVTKKEVTLPNLAINPSLRAKLGVGGPAVQLAPSDDLILAERVIQPNSQELAAMNAAVDKVINAYQAANSPPEKAACVVDAERILPLMRRFYAREADDTDLVGNLVRRTFYELKGVEYAIDRRTLDDGSGRLIYVAYRRTGKQAQEYKIDWESLVGYGELSWDELLSTRPEKPILFRCYANRDNYYNFGYADPQRWNCIRLINHRNGETIYGYVRVGTRAEARISEALRVRSPASLTLRLSFPENIEAGHRQVRIDEVIQGTWLIVR